MTKPWPTPEPFWKPRDDSPYKGGEPSTDGAKLPPSPLVNEQPMPAVDGD